MSKGKTKRAVKTKCREIMSRYDDDQPIIGADAEFLEELLSSHPRAEEKIGCGIHAFIVVREKDIWRNSRHFAVIRKDGSRAGFSFTVCVHGRTHKQMVIRALRMAVLPQILKAKDLVFECDPEPVCIFTNQVLTRDNCNVDHIPPDTFASLVERWMAQEQLDFDRIPLRPSTSNEYLNYLTQKDQLESWMRFHLTNARLRVISAKANQGIVRKEAEAQRKPEEAVAA